MPRFAANLSLMFNEVDFMARFGAAGEAGFTGVEYLFPYAFAPETIAAELQRLGLSQVLFNLPPGDWAAGERGIAALPGREAEFRQSVDTALRYAEATGCQRLHVMAGNVTDPADRPAIEQTYRENLRYAARLLADAGVTLLIEPINTRDMPAYFLNHQSVAHALVAELGEPNIAVQMDFYHAQIMGGDLWTTFDAYRDNVGHIQIASVPDRHEPGTGEVNYSWLFDQLDASHYSGWIGCEYTPRGDTQAGLEWFAPYAKQNRDR